MNGPIGTLPRGTFRKAGVGPFILPCLERVPAPVGHGHCFRPQGHGGRHAFIAESGRVWAVWGDDVHKAARERARLDEILANVVPAVPDSDIVTVGEPPC